MLVKRNMDEMITHFNDVVSAMDISIKDKMTILGMITAIGYEYQKSADAIEELQGFLYEAERDMDEYRDRMEKTFEIMPHMADALVKRLEDKNGNDGEN